MPLVPNKFAGQAPDYPKRLNCGSAAGLFAKEGAFQCVADVALEFSELAQVVEIRSDTIAYSAQHGHRDHHPERRNPAGSASESARLTPGIEPVRNRVLTVDGDFRSRLGQKFLDGQRRAPFR
jgi:hypothetical protein